MNSEIAFQKEQLATKNNYFHEEIIFLQKLLNRVFKKLTNNENHCSRIKPTFHHILPNKVIGQNWYNRWWKQNFQIELIQQMVEAKKHIQNPRHIQDTVITSVTKRFFSEPCVTLTYLQPFTTLGYSGIKTYSEPSRISKMKHFIKNPA